MKWYSAHEATLWVIICWLAIFVVFYKNYEIAKLRATIDAREITVASKNANGDSEAKVTQVRFFNAQWCVHIYDSRDDVQACAQELYEAVRLCYENSKFDASEKKHYVDKVEVKVERKKR